MKRFFASFVGFSMAAGAVGAAPDKLVAAGPESASIQTVSGGRLSGGRPALRRYRSYSIEPGGVGSGAAVGGAVESAPRFVPPAPARPSKPSYLRGDAKARGQFHR